MQRRLTTIVAADIAGFSRLVGVDEEGTLAARRAHRAELIDPLLARHGGRIANTAGDSLLIEFSSAVEAMRYAVAMQAGMRERNANVPAARRIEYRIGVNVGDVMAEGDDLLGDGVNVAARLEALAPAGGIVASRAIRDAVRDRLTLDLADLGEVAVKNIARPVRAFQVLRTGERALRPPSATPRRRLRPVAAAVLVVATALASGAYWYVQQPDVTPADPARMAFALPSGPSIAVLPFAVAGTDEADGRLGDGLAQDVTDLLGRFGDLTVIASESTAIYKETATPLRQVAEELGVAHVLTGSIDREGERLRISVRLVDALTGQQAWAERYDADGADIFAVRDDIAQTIASAIGAKESPIIAATLAASKRKDTAELAAYELVLLAVDLRHRFDREDNARALALLERALELDPHYARAHSDLAWTHWQDVINGFTDTPGLSIQKAVASAEAAIRADPYLSDGYWVLASVSVCESDDLAKALALYRKAMELNPGHPGIMVEWGGFILPQSLEQGDEGVALVERAKRLNPRYPDWYNGAAVAALLFARRPEEAVRAYEAVEYPQLATRVYFAAAAGHAGQTERARRAVAQLLEIEPDYRLRTLFERAELCPKGATEGTLAYLREGLAKAGLPE